MPDSDFENFVRARITDIHDGQTRLATEVLRVLPRVDTLEWNDKKHDRILVGHDERLDKHTVRLDTHERRLDEHETKIASRHRSSIPPIASLGKATESGSWHVTQEVYEKFQEMITGLRDEVETLQASTALEKTKREAVEAALKEQRETAEKAADRASSKLRGWIAIAISLAIVAGALFTWLSTHTQPAPVQTTISAPAPATH